MIEDSRKEQTANTQRKFITNVVCPICFDQVEWPVIMTEGPDGEGRKLRTYFGYCSHCGAAHVVVQFAREDRWIIHKFRPAVIVGIANPVELSSEWKLMSELPKPDDGVPKTEDSQADYAEIAKSLEKAHKELMGLAGTIELLIRHLAEQRGQAIDD